MAEDQVLRATGVCDRRVYRTAAVAQVGLGALVGYYSDDGKDFSYAGKVGTGFTNQMLIDLRQRLEKMEVNNSPFTRGDPPTSEHVHWVKPKFLAEIAFAEWTHHGLLRQPRFEGLREDKPASAARRERPRFYRRPCMPVAEREVKFTHTDRVMFPEAGITKGDLLDYYDRVATKLLPHLRDRPMTLKGCPEVLAANPPRISGRRTRRTITRSGFRASRCPPRTGGRSSTCW